MAEARDANDPAPRDEQRLHAELFEKALGAMRERRWSRRAHASRTEIVDAVLAKHGQALKALPDD